MRIKLPARATMTEKGHVFLKEVDASGKGLLKRLFDKKREWEQRNQKEFFLIVELDLQYQKRTYKQNNSVWKLIEVIWYSMEKDPPTQEEKYDLYLDLLELYADKKISRLTGQKRAIHISESNSMEGARFIDGLLYHLSTMCDLDYNGQTSLVDVLYEWADWRGSLKIDPVDYSDPECTKLLTEAEWRERRRISEASGRGGQIELAHIVSRGSDAADIEKSWNWMALLHEEHRDQHRIGWDGFLQKYPHLRGRVNRARNMAKKLELEFKSSQPAMPHTSENLALEALG